MADTENKRDKNRDKKRQRSANAEAASTENLSPADVNEAVDVTQDDAGNESSVDSSADTSVGSLIAAAKLEWAAAGLDFVEDTPAEAMTSDAVDIDATNEAASEAGASETSLSKIEALARRVAETVAHNEGLNDPNLDLSVAPTEEALENAQGDDMEQMGFMALEQELDAAENDADQNPEEFVDKDQLLSIIESLLFSTDKPISVATIKALFKGTNVRTKDISRALDLIASDYASPTRGVTLEEINGGYQLRTKSDNTAFLRRLGKVRPFRLSGPALEVMSIIAYKQPVTKHEVDEIRGVESGHLVRALMERGLVCFNGKAENMPGKPMAYGTTRKFLETFGLRNIRELPTLAEIDELLPEGIGDEIEEKESLSDLTAKLSNEITGSYSEGEEELQKIAASLQSVDTTTEFFEQEKERERERRDRERAQDIRERLMLETEVEAKDRRWLERFDAKAAEAELAKHQPAPVAAEVAPITGDLENLSDESAALAEIKASEADAAQTAEEEELAAAFDNYDDEEAAEGFGGDADHEPHEGDV